MIDPSDFIPSEYRPGELWGKLPTRLRAFGKLVKDKIRGTEPENFDTQEFVLVKLKEANRPLHTFQVASRTDRALVREHRMSTFEIYRHLTALEQRGKVKRSKSALDVDLWEAL